MCKCINIEIGSYDNQEKLHAPNWSSREYICVDRCLVNEIRALWNLGIITTGCCCGHNQMESFIGVLDKFIPQMRGLGYMVHFNQCRPNDEDSFISKTI